MWNITDTLIITSLSKIHLNSSASWMHTWAHLTNKNFMFVFSIIKTVLQPNNWHNNIAALNPLALIIEREKWSSWKRRKMIAWFLESVYHIRDCWCFQQPWTIEIQRSLCWFECKVFAQWNVSISTHSRLRGVRDHVERSLTKGTHYY